MDEKTAKLIALIASEFQGELLVFSEPMLSGKQLLKKWPGLSVRELIQGVDDTNDRTNPSVASNPYNMSDFPLSYMLIGTLFDEDFKKHYLCLSCESDYSQGRPYYRPYKMRMEGKKRKYKLKRIVFKKADIEKFETDENEWLSDIQHEALELHNSVEKVDYQIKSAWWAGTTPEAMVNNFLEMRIANEIIAYMLVEVRSVPLTAAGRLLAVEENERGIELDVKTYQRRANRMLQKARALYNITLEN